MGRKFQLGPIEVKPGTRQDVELPVVMRPIGDMLSIPLIVINGGKRGPRLYVNGGTHGDEVEAAVAIIDIANGLNPENLAGTFIGVPILNPQSYMAKASIDVSGIRENPTDWKNLARVFPGKADGTVTERIAHVVSNCLVPSVDYIVDIHSGGTRGTSIRMSGFVAAEGELGHKSIELAKLFPFEVIWRTPPWAKFASVALQHGVPMTIVEVTGQGRAEEEDVKLCVLGVRNIMKHLGMIEGSLEGIPTRRKYIDSETYIYASTGGLFRPRVKTGYLMSEGDVLGETVNVYGHVTERFIAPSDGLVTGIRTKPVVWAGEPVLLVSSFIPDPAIEMSTTRVAGDVTPP